MLLLLKTTPFLGPTFSEFFEHEHDDPFSCIRCPDCSWRPDRTSLWSCHWEDTPEPRFNACGTTWNTFLTRGRCPGCTHQWRWTSCLLCGEWSLHEEWYEDK